MLCYAWDVLDADTDRPPVPVEAITPPHQMQLVAIFAALFLQELSRILSRGVHQGYQRREAAVAGVRGRIQFAKLARTGISQASLPCVFEELTVNTLPNQIVKATLGLLLTMDLPLRDAEIAKADATHLYRCLAEVSDVRLSRRAFENLDRQQVPPDYRLVLALCRLLQSGALITGSHERDVQFPWFRADVRPMRVLFERFVSGFYAAHVSDRFRTKRQRVISWPWTAATDMSSGDVLPAMRTDLYLQSMTAGHRDVLIECKFTDRWWDRQTQYAGAKRTLRAPHLYQLNAYLDALDCSGEAEAACEAILLYPLTTDPASYTFARGAHRVRVVTLDLQQPWDGIHRDLLDLVAPALR